MSLFQCTNICKDYNEAKIISHASLKRRRGKIFFLHSKKNLEIEGRYKGTPVIQNVNLRLEEGEIVSLLGISGVGKSTLMNILAGVEIPDVGHVILEGEDITGKAGRVGYMLQKDLLLPFKTTLDNICLPLILRGMKKTEAREKARAQMQVFGLSGSEDKYPYQLSGGMRQRAALARTYFLGNKVILLDEPFVALDAITKSEMHSWYRNIAKQMGLSTIIITHDVDEALVLSDRVYIMAGNPGKITQELKIKKENKENFAFTEQYLVYKRKVLDYIK